MVRLFAIAFTPEWARRIEYLCTRRDDLQLALLTFGGGNALEQLRNASAQVIAVEGGPDWAAVIEVTRSIMEAHPLPLVVLVNDDTDSATSLADRALEAGALRVLTIPALDESPDEQPLAEQFAKSLRLMSEIKVVRRWDSAKLESLSRPMQGTPPVGRQDQHFGVIGIGASAGGTKALQEVFSHLPSTFPLPILVVQHIAKGYLNGLARWLGEQTDLRVMIAENGCALEGGRVYLAPDDAHLTVDGKHRILLADDEPVNGFKPSIDRLFRGIYESYGGHAIAVLLSGMGNDGAQEMRRLHLAGAVTIAQDKATSLIHGIPGEAIKLAAVSSVLPIQEIGPALLSLTSVKHA
jgi:two-component system chemotaxis response regulator CheB